MDPKKHPLTEVADLLTTLRPARPGMYCLHVHCHDINICICGLEHKDCPTIAMIKGSDINNGLTRQLWNEVEDKIRTYLKEGVLKWQAPKP